MLLAYQPNLVNQRKSVIADLSGRQRQFKNHQTVDSTEKRMLVEATEQNLVLQSNTFSNASWTKTGSVTISSADVPGPIDYVSAVAAKLTSADTGNLEQAVTLAASTTYTLSVFLKPLVTGVGTVNVGIASVGSTSISLVGSGAGSAELSWKRVSFTFTTTSSGSYTIRIGIANHAGTTVTGPSTYAIFGVQLCKGKYPGRYYATTTTANTSNQARTFERFWDEGKPIPGQALAPVTNLCTYSERISAWSANSGVTTALSTSTTWVDGTTYSTAVTETAASSHSIVNLIYSSPAPTSTRFTLSFSIKGGLRNNFLATLGNTGSTVGGTMLINTTTGTLGTITTLGGTTTPTGTITSEGNGWYRCVLNASTGASAIDWYVGIQALDASNNGTYTGNTGSVSFYVTRVQVEATLSTDGANDYVPTTSTTATTFAPTRSSVTASTVLGAVAPLDQVGVEPIMAVGFRKLRSNYQGYACKVRRAADDATVDVGFLPDGSLDVYTMMNFIGVQNYNWGSENLNSGSWSATGSPVISTNIGVAPDGNFTANYFQRSTTAASYTVQTTNVGASGETYTYSIYAKRGGTKYLNMMFANVYPIRVDAVFDLLEGTCVYFSKTTITRASPTITYVGNGWYRCSISMVLTQINMSCYISAGDSNTTADGITGTAYNGIFVWGAMLNKGALLDYCRAVGSTTTSGRGHVFSMYDQSYNACYQQNLMTNTTNMSSGWAPAGNTSSTTATIVDPTGTSSSVRKIFESTTTNSTHNFNYSSAINFNCMPPGSTVTFSIYAKAAERTQIQVILSDNGTGGNDSCSAVFNLLNGTRVETVDTSGTSGTWTTVSSYVSSMDANGWCRCVVTASTGAYMASGVFCVVRIVEPNPASGSTSTKQYIGTVNSGLYIWGGQVNVGKEIPYYAVTTTESLPNNLTQNSFNRQPIIARDGIIERINGQPAVFFDGTLNHRMTTGQNAGSSLTSMALPYTVNSAWKMKDLPTAKGDIIADGAGSTPNLTIENETTWQGNGLLKVGSTTIGTGLAAHNLGITTLRWNSNASSICTSSSVFTFNGSSTVLNAANSTMSGIGIGGNNGIWTGWLGALTVWNTDIGKSNADLIEASQRMFWGNEFTGKDNTYLLDRLHPSTQAAVGQAHSTRKLTASYKGAAVKLMRDNDATFKDFNFLTNGELDIYSIAEFIGAENKLTNTTTWSDWTAVTSTFTDYDNTYGLNPRGRIGGVKFLKMDGTTGFHYIQTNVTLSSAVGDYTASVYVKMPNSYGGNGIIRSVSIQVDSAFSPTKTGGWFNFGSGSAAPTTSAIGGSVVSYTYVGYGWYRFSTTIAVGTSTTNKLYIELGNSSSVDSGLVGDSSSGMLLWGPSLCTGSTAKMYYPTTTANTTENYGGVDRWYDQGPNWTHHNFIPRSTAFDSSWGTDFATFSTTAVLAPFDTKNLLYASEDLSNTTYWTLNGVTLNGTVDINNVTLFSILPSTANTEKYAEQAISTTGVGNWISSCYAHSNGYSTISMEAVHTGDGGGTSTVSFDMSNKTFTVGTNTAIASYGYDEVAPSTFRVWIKFSTTSSCSSIRSRYSVNSPDPYVGTGTDAIYLGGCMLESSTDTQAQAYVRSPSYPYAMKLAEDNSLANHIAYVNIYSPVIIGGNTTVSIYAKAAERSVLWIRLYEDTYTKWGNAQFDLSGVGQCMFSSATSSTTPITLVPTITYVGNGWYRCSATVKTYDENQVQVQFCIGNGTYGSSAINYTGTFGSGIYIWGASYNYGDTAVPHVENTDTGKLYNHRDLTADFNEGPLIFGAGVPYNFGLDPNLRPAPLTDGVNYKMYSLSYFKAQPVSRVHTIQFGSTLQTNDYLVDNDTSTPFPLYLSTASTLSVYGGTNGPSVDTSVEAFRSATIVTVSDSTTRYAKPQRVAANGVVLSYNGNAFNNATLGTSGVEGLQLSVNKTANAWYGDQIVFGTALNLDEIKTLENDMKNYWLTPGGQSLNFKP